MKRSADDFMGCDTNISVWKMVANYNWYVAHKKRK